MPIKEETREIKLATREWDRLVNKGVGRSFCKTLTEPITNSDTSYKRKLNIPMATGLVNEIFKIPKGTVLDTSVIKSSLEKKGLTRRIQIEIALAKGHKGIKTRQCRIIDNAEGMDYETLGSMEEYAGDKTKVSKGKPGRSLFGRGLSDVLLYHKNASVHSVVEGRIYAATDFGIKSEGKVNYKTKNLGHATKSLRKRYNLPIVGNGTCVQFTISKECAIPAKERFRSLLCNFYMLRLISADPNTEIWVKRYETQEQVEQYQLEYDFPIGQVIGKIGTSMEYPFRSKKYALNIEGIIVRSDAKLRGVSGDLDARENGIIITDDNDAILDQTLLPAYERAPYLQSIYGIIRINGIRSLLFDHLEAGKEAADVLTVSRDGFDQKHKFAIELFKILEKQLKPIYDREKELYEKRQGGEHQAEIQNRIRDALKPLNEFFKEQTEEFGKGADIQTPDETKDIQFIPSETYLRVKREKLVYLLVKSDKVINEEVILIDSGNDKIQVRPDSITINVKRRDKKGYLKHQVYIFCEELHEKGIITALTPAAGRKSDLLANLSITDVKGEATPLPPPELMEFRPVKSNGQPNKLASALLYINLNKIPIGRKIKVEQSKAKGNITLLYGDNKTTSFKITVSRDHEVSLGSIARFPVLFRGTGKGQHAEIHASTKTIDGNTAFAIGKIEIKEPEIEGGGIFEKAEYESLEQPVCAMVADSVIWVNSEHPINRSVFGVNKAQFDDKLLHNFEAQLRYAEVILDTAVFYTAQIKERIGGRKGLIIRPNMAVQDIQAYIDENKFKLASKVYKILVPGFRAAKAK